MITPEREAEMMAEREAILEGDPNANNAEKGAINADLQKAQWEAEAKASAEATANDSKNRPTEGSPDAPVYGTGKIGGTSAPGGTSARAIPTSTPSAPTTPSSGDTGGDASGGTSGTV